MEFRLLLMFNYYKPWEPPLVLWYIHGKKQEGGWTKASVALEEIMTWILGKITASWGRNMQSNVLESQLSG